MDIALFVTSREVVFYRPSDMHENVLRRNHVDHLTQMGHCGVFPSIAVGVRIGFDTNINISSRIHRFDVATLWTDSLSNVGY